MGVEIERKFLVTDDSWRSAATEAIPMEQGYLAGSGVTVRVRRSGDRAWLTIKGPTAAGGSPAVNSNTPSRSAMPLTC